MKRLLWIVTTLLILCTCGCTSRSVEKNRAVQISAVAHSAPASASVAPLAPRPIFPPPGKTHGPLLVYSPPPLLPDDLKGKIGSPSVTFDFSISPKGTVHPKIVKSTGNRTLDQIALETGKTWRFTPAEENGKPTPSKMRIRAVFSSR